MFSRWRGAFLNVESRRAKNEDAAERNSMSWQRQKKNPHFQHREEFPSACAYAVFIYTYIKKFKFSIFISNARQVVVRLC